MSKAPKLFLAAALAVGAVACSGQRDVSGLGPAHAQYVAARDASPPNDELTIRHFYAAYLEALRSKNPRLGMRFFRPDAHPEALNAVRMGLELGRTLDALGGEILELREAGGRALLRVRENATFKLRGKSSSDRRDRLYQLVRIGRDWYIEPPDLGQARKRA